MLTASELHARGLRASNAGRPTTAWRLFERALQRADESDPDVLARIQLSVAHLQAERGSVDEGVRRCEAALALPGLSQQVQGLIHSQFGLLYMRSGDGARALPEFAEAIRLLDETPEPLATAYHNRGLLHVLRGNSYQAQADLELALSYSRKAGDEMLAAKSQHNLGCARLQTGDLVGALTMMQQARPSFDDSPIYAAVGDQDRAEALVAAGMTHDAAAALTAAARLLGSHRQRQRQGEAELVLARLLLTEEPREARDAARRARRLFTARGSRAWALRAEALELAARSQLRRGLRDATRRAGPVAAQLRELGLKADATELELRTALNHVILSDLDSARENLRRARVSRRASLGTQLLDREVRVELAIATNRPRQALHHVRRGLAELHEWQSSFGSLDLQSSLVGHGRTLALQGLSLAATDGRPEVVFEWSERARALASRVAPVRPPADEQAAHDLTELRNVQADLAVAERNGKPPPALRQRADELRARIRQRAWYDKGSGLVTEPETLTAVQQRMATDEAVVNIVAVNGRLHALVVGADSADVVHMGPLAPVRSLLDGMLADLDMAAAHLPGPMRQAVHGGLGQRLVQLSSLLVGPWSRHVRDRRVVVVPSGALAGTPWTLLPDLAGQPVTVPRSASEWATSRHQTRRLRTAGFVAGPRVDRAHEEVKRAAQAWRSADVLIGDDVRADQVRKMASQVDVFHVAAHGRHSADNPLFSGLELSDGPWFGYDIDQVETIPATVILSACELGRSTVRWGEETIGMTVAWLHAGARCVIASPALVDDDVACEVLAATHRQLAAGVQPADALAEAMASTESGVAPFICFGSGW